MPSSLSRTLKLILMDSGRLWSSATHLIYYCVIISFVMAVVSFLRPHIDRVRARREEHNSRLDGEYQRVAQEGT